MIQNDPASHPDSFDSSNAQQIPQTQQGKYSDRLSNESKSGHHEGFRLDWVKQNYGTLK
jgi:hypothetical protein